MNILVTGGAGYIGSRLVPALQAQGHWVTVLDSLLYPSENSNNDLIADHFIVGDVRDRDLVKHAMKGQDAVIHLAFLSNDPHHGLDPAISQSVNLGGTENIAKIARDSGVQRLIFASSCSVYGQCPPDHTCVETDTPHPLTSYAHHKLACEDIIAQARGDNLSVTALRAATVCGPSPRMRMDLSFNRMVGQAFRDHVIPVSSMHRIRPKIHIADLVNLYCSLISAPGTQVDHQIFNAAYENDTVGTAATLIAASCPHAVTVQAEKNSHHPDQRSYRVSADRLTDILDFTPKYGLKAAAEDLFSALYRGEITADLDLPGHNNQIMQQNLFSRTPECKKTGS